MKRAAFFFPAFAVAIGVGLHAAGVPWWVPSAIALVLFVVLGWRDHRRRGELPPYVEVKQYPPGCTCVPGAFLDSVTCPHHRDSYWSSRDH